LRPRTRSRRTRSINTGCVEKFADRLQQRLKPHALPQQFEIGKAHLPHCRPRHGSTQQTQKCRPQAGRSVAHPAPDHRGKLFGGTNHPTNEKTSSLLLASKTCGRKTLEMPILPYYFAFRDRN